MEISQASRKSRLVIAVFALGAGSGLVFGACGKGTVPGTLIGTYAVRGVLVENSCGQIALPTVNPLDFVVEIRDDDGIGYWVPTKTSRNTGSLDDDGSFRFSLTQTKVASQAASGPNGQSQPSDFLASPETNPDLKQSTCALTINEVIAGTLQRRQDATGAVIGSAASSPTGQTDDLTAQHTIQVSPATASTCQSELAALGGTYLSLPCVARYVLRGELVADESSAAPQNTAGTTPAAGTTAPPATASGGTTSVPIGGTSGSSTAVVAGAPAPAP